MDVGAVEHVWDGAAMPLVRTSFGDEAAWARVRDAVLLERELVPGRGGGLAAPNVVAVDDRVFEDLAAEECPVVFGDLHGHYLLLADEWSLRDPTRGLLCVDVSRGDSFRCAIDAVVMVEPNLSTANLDFEELAGSVDADGIYRTR